MQGLKWYLWSLKYWKPLSLVQKFVHCVLFLTKRFIAIRWRITQHLERPACQLRNYWQLGLSAGLSVSLGTSGIPDVISHQALPDMPNTMGLSQSVPMVYTSSSSLANPSKHSLGGPSMGLWICRHQQHQIMFVTFLYLIGFMGILIYNILKALNILLRRPMVVTGTLKVRLITGVGTLFQLSSFELYQQWMSSPSS